MTNDSKEARAYGIPGQVETISGVVLTEAQIAILRRMAREHGEGAMTAEWIAEGCDHFYDTPWAGNRLPGLIKRGLVEKLSPGWYRITDGGMTAIHASVSDTPDRQRIPGVDQ